MTANAPTLDQWRSLFARAALVKKMAPWEWMEEIDLFGVQDPDSGSVDFVSVMGMAGEHFAVALYRGPGALRDFLELHDAPPIESPERIMEIPQLQLSFEDREFLDDDDRKLIKKMDLRFRGAHAWPQFRAFHPGFFPWFLEAEEARLLDLVLEQLLDVAPRFDRDPQLLLTQIPNTFLVRVPEGGVWRDRYLPIPPPEPPPEPIPLDPFTLSRFQRLASSPRILEVDLFHFWSPAREEEDQRPYYPYVLALVDASSSEIVSFDMLTPLPSLEEMRRSAPLSLLEQFEKLGNLPREIRVRSPRLFTALGPATEALSIALELQPSLPFLEQVKEHLTQAAGAGFDPSLVPVDFDPGGSPPFDAEEEGAAFSPDLFPAFPFATDADEDEGFGEFLASAFADFFMEGPVDPLDTMAAILPRKSGSLPTADIDFHAILSAATIDADGPGSILGDFAALIDAIPAKGVEVTMSARLPKLHFVAALNQRLAHPLALGLQRPQPKSYPNVCGLYMLLRATGLGHLRDGRHLQLDADLLNSWRHLNPTEQYFVLLESWLLRSDLELVGERTHPLYNPIRLWSDFHLDIPGAGLPVADHYEKYNGLNYAPGLPNLALMELFGLLTLEYAPSAAGEGWRIQRAARTPFGDGLLARLFDYLSTQWQEPTGEPPAPGRLQPVFKPFFPEWVAHLSIPREDFSEETHIFKVSVAPEIWRRLAAPAGGNLAQLAAGILDAFDFDHDHLYSFLCKSRTGTTFRINHPQLGEPLFADQVRIGDLPLQPTDSMTFLYDFGDEWEFRLQLERLEAPDRRRKKPTLLESHGEAPEQYPDWDEY